MSKDILLRFLMPDAKNMLISSAFKQDFHENFRIFSCVCLPFDIMTKTFIQEAFIMELTSALDYFIAITGILIIVVSFAWNIYEVFFHRSHSETSEDSAMR